MCQRLGSQLNSYYADFWQAISMMEQHLDHVFSLSSCSVSRIRHVLSELMNMIQGVNYSGHQQLPTVPPPPPPSVVSPKRRYKVPPLPTSGAHTLQCGSYQTNLSSVRIVLLAFACFCGDLITFDIVVTDTINDSDTL